MIQQLFPCCCGKAGSRMDITEQIRKMYGDREPVLRESRQQGAGVLIPLLEKDGCTQVLFEVRASHLDAQPGEVCLPGGRMEPGENGAQTAVRETCEELLIPESQVEVISPLDGFIGPGGRPLWVTLGRLHDYRGTFSPEEVDHVFTIPLQWFAENEPERYVTRQATQPGENFPYDRIPRGRNYAWRERPYEVFFYNWPGEELWGITARIMHQLSEDCRMLCSGGK